MLKVTFEIPPDHPCLVGHFPGQPIAPGVLTLDQVAQGLLRQQIGTRLVGFPQVKFMRPVLPAHSIEVSYTKKSEMLFQFKCECDGDPLIKGQIRLAKKAE